MAVVGSAAAAAAKKRHRATLWLLACLAAAAVVVWRAGGEQRAWRPAASCRTKALLPLKNRLLMGQLLEAEGFTTGAELGVQKGWFANQTLSTWPSCRKYYLVDIWAQQVRRGTPCVPACDCTSRVDCTRPAPPPFSVVLVSLCLQPNYVESANVPNAVQQQFMDVALERLAPWADKTVVMR